MSRLGLRSYRFSIAWPRITDSEGRPNQRGIGFYSRLADALLTAGIEPVATVYHWDLPQYLEDRGGWINRDTAFRMADYAGILGSQLGDRIGTWITLNEPWCVAFGGYGTGTSAPGRTGALTALQAAHHLNLAHGAAMAALRDTLPATATVAITLNLHQFQPATDSPADADAVRHADALANRIFLTPIMDGRYPDDLIADTANVTDWSFVHAGDLHVIHARPDALGLNYYSPWVLADPATPMPPSQVSDPPSLWPVTDRVLWLDPPPPHTDMGWTIDPAAFTDLLLRVHHDYPDLPLVVTENGAACHGDVQPGAVVDTERIRYLSDHINAVGAAISRGADIRGYFVWSLIDTFEWSGGYHWKFGLIGVDYASQRPTVKQSGYWYRDLMARFRALHGSPTVAR
jgi:beta-glucosidase